MVDSPHALLALLRPGTSVYLPGATGESLALAALLAANADRMRGVHVVSCLVPGMNETLDYAALAPDVRVTTFMLPHVMQASFRVGRVDLVPSTYWRAAQHLGTLRCDVAIAHVAPPDADGNCSLGIASDFAPLIWPNARKRVLVVNPSMPCIPRARTLRVSDADLVVTLDGPLVETRPPADDSLGDAVAHKVASLIPDGARLQTGIGAAPAALWRHLAGHRNLVLRSGMANGWLRDLAEAGVLDPGGDHVAGIACGTRGFYDYLARSDLVRFGTTLETHGLPALVQLPGLTSVNGALEVDLFGQVNVEWQGDTLSSGVGGGPDFMRAAAASPGGRSIVALPASAKQGAISRIVARLDRPSVSIARSDIDTVVTEHGIADLRGKGMDARAEALIGIADPAWRDRLWEQWRALRATF